MCVSSHSTWSLSVHCSLINFYSPSADYSWFGFTWHDIIHSTLRTLLIFTQLTYLYANMHLRCTSFSQLLFLIYFLSNVYSQLFMCTVIYFSAILPCYVIILIIISQVLFCTDVSYFHSVYNLSCTSCVFFLVYLLMSTLCAPLNCPRGTNKVSWTGI